MTLVYRAMRRDPDGQPFLTHQSSVGLGVRPDVDISPDEVGFVDQLGEGMSVATAPEALPYARRPLSYGGEGKHPVWVLDTNELDERLVYNQQDERKGFIEPAGRMELRDYQDAIEETRDLWSESE